MKKSTPIVSLLFIGAVIWLVFYASMPRYAANETISLSEFSTKRALQQVSRLSAQPHYVGSSSHTQTVKYLKSELQKLGLETQIQEGYTLTEWGNLVKSKNILARIEGSDSSKALMLLSHYDSAPHSKSHGAADDASGIATILEATRTFLHNKTAHKNDIVILFSDAEELGLNGAALFVTQHNWAKEIGFVLNFEARGTSGPAYMLMETNNGNQEIVSQFSQAGVPFAASNSLMYSIYKMLPNDTDLTVFRENGKIQGLNFAFIDDHFNYHTQQDDFQRLNPDAVEHDGKYIMPLLNHFSNADLTKLDADSDDVYFNIPFGFVHYPFGWNLPLLVLSIVLFLGLLFVGFGKRIISGKEVGKGFLLLFSALVVTIAVSFFGWKILLEIYPDYKEILHGFTYNGHSYIVAFLLLTLAVCFLFYRRSVASSISVNYAVAPYVLWLVINACICAYLPGAGFFIIPVFASLLGFAYFIVTQRTNYFLYLIFSVPTLVLIVPFAILFPIGLGLKILFGSALLITLSFGLLLPVLGSFPRKGLWSLICFLISGGFLVHAHLNSGFEKGKAKPNSLVYFLDADTDKAVWATYDLKPDDWTKIYLGENPKNAKALNRNPLFSKYNTEFSFSADAPRKPLSGPSIRFERDTIIGNQHYYTILIQPNRKVNRYDIFASEKLTFHNLKTNDVSHLAQEGSQYARNGRKLLSYYVIDNAPLELRFSVGKDAVLDMELIESSFDLLENPSFSVPKRPEWMMPKPFILNDAVIIQKKIKPETVAVSLPVNDTINAAN